jgi:hypothetical protein
MSLRWKLIAGIVSFILIVPSGCAPIQETPLLEENLEFFSPPPFECEFDGSTQICQTPNREDYDDWSMLLGIRQEKGDYLDVQVEIPAQKDHPEIILVILPLTNQQEIISAKSGFPIFRLIASFEVRDGDTNQLITEFDPGLRIKITFTPDQWVNWSLSGASRPRLAYLVWKDGHWEDSWIEFTEDDIIAIIPPGSDEETPELGILIIEIFEWLDPLIGGC